MVFISILFLSHFCCACIIFEFVTIEKRREFERRRKLHYNEFEAVRIARELMVRDEDEEEEDDVEFANSNEMDMDVNDGSNSNTTVESVYNKQSTSHF